MDSDKPAQPPCNEINADSVRRFRELTGAGMMDAKKALVKADGDFYLAQGIIKYQGCAIYVKGKTHNEWVMDRARSWAEELRKKDK